MTTIERNIVVRNEHFDPDADPRIVDLLFGPLNDDEIVEHVDEVPDVFALLVELGVFSSRSQARKNWKRGTIVPGWNDFEKIGKLRHRISVWVPIP